MRIGRNSVWNGVRLACAVASFTLPVLGQSAIGSGTTMHRASHPYTAQFKITSEQTLANGTKITRESTEIQAEDSQGRHLTGTTTPATEQVPEHSISHVNDPVARTTTSWVIPGRSATVRQMPPLHQPGQPQTCWASGTQTTASVSNPVERSSSGSVTITNTLSAQPRTSALETTKEDLGK